VNNSASAKLLLQTEATEVDKSEDQAPVKKSLANARVTIREYYCFILSIRMVISLLFFGGKLLQKFFCLSWLKTQDNHLELLRKEEYQKKLRAFTYTNVIEAVKRRAEKRGVQPGKVIILPSKFHVSY
jgi:hypothetical protein